ncbi:ABC transporter ATP-binding protein [Campylobacter sp. LH-2024]|uniref:ABC transporter ATP-binding protein n=1 Tax=Campylobacter molothri TaxID=1032242 RepID=A0ACC5W0D2_9BACT|nr:ABC transporter ATP-binding protein [Campylobacter sp. 2018MI35]MBZ7928032.1 ABC transporter ATP-binding protein [Campylobacter sp. RM10542]MBZ7930679.1 ABC transporter ATP-binding protein [Campylobacter sp. RM12910]MBZ7932170.1 ABC transporter ATP-binding protein [Campylobacter sp. RM10543]MBZ7950387.1 ABC transporter ATP-binding protein [Campylobacter sp. W0046]MBZ7957737.1 ABC transporter ATP-binding protein [Campylobacter sp. RM9760]MBZ7959690.1 ABC transporter ATP-binding protein [Cam
MHKEMNLKEVLIRFKPFYKRYWRQFVIVGIGMLLASGGTSATAYMIKPILDQIFIEKKETMLYIVPFLFILVYFLKNAGSYLQTYYISYIGTDMLRVLRSKVLKNILRLDMDFFKQHRSGELISRCTNDIGALQSIVSNIIPDFLTQLITAIGLLSVVVIQSPRLAFFALIVLPIAIIPLFYLIKKLKLYARNIQEKNSDLLSRLGEIFSNIELVKANNAQEKERQKFDQENKFFCKIILKSTRIGSLTSPLMEIIGSIGVAVVIIVGGREVIKGNMSVGSFFSFISALFWAYTPIKRLSNLYGSIQGAIAASERTFYLLDLEPKIKGGDKELKSIKNIKFKEVEFAYDDFSKKVLNGIDFEFSKGETLALVGMSGGGKSSIINLIMYFYEKNKGEILFNDLDIHHFNIKSLRDKIGLVTQNIYLFNDSFAENVAYSENLDEKRVIEALKLANAYEFVESMGGIYAEIKEHGKNLSGGQKQRIAIARALYKNPDLLIFDEATSALDNESEKAIMQTIESLKKERLILMIAHRLSTVENADKIVIIDKGKVLAIGKDEELLKTCELYRKFKNKEKEMKA